MKTCESKAVSDVYKVIPAFAVLILLMVSIAILSVYSFTHTQLKVQKVESQFQPEMLGAMQLTAQLYHSLSFVGSYMLKQDEYSLTSYSNKIHAIDITLSNLVKLTESDSEYGDKDRLMTISHLVSQLKLANQELLGLAGNNGLNFPAIGKASNQLEPLGARVLLQINDFLIIAEQNSQYDLLYNISNLRLVWVLLVSEARNYLAFRNETTLDSMDMYIAGLLQAEALINQEKKHLDVEQLDIFEDLSSDLKLYIPLLRKISFQHSREGWRLDSLIMRDKISPTLEKLTIELDQLVLIQQGRIKDIYRALSNQIDIASSLIYGAAAIASIIIMYLILGKFRIQRLERRLMNQKLRESKLWHKAHYDYLTNLASRSLFNEQLIQTINTPEEQDCFTLLFIDLDGFKVVNDTVSHAAGDYILIETAKRLKAAVRTNDLVARLGGDEFVILLYGSNNRATINSTAQKICNSIAKEFIYDQQRILISCSIGIVLSNEANAVSGLHPAPSIAKQLMASADKAMYLAKKNGKNGFSFNKVTLKAVV